MDVAEFLNRRVEEVAAFSALLFRRRPRQDDDGDGGREELRSVVNYRRPSSENVPLSAVMPLARLRTRRSRRFDRSSTTEGKLSSSSSQLTTAGEGGRQKKKRLLTYKAWCLLLKRRRRLALRRRGTALRRIRRRIIALRHGKMQLPLCNCSNVTTSTTSTTSSSALTSRVSTASRTAVLWLPSHKQLCRRFHYSIDKMCIDGCPSSPSHDSPPPDCVKVMIAVPMKSQRKQHRVMQRWVARLQETSTTKRPSKRGPGRKPMALPPPLCFVAERSHICVWSVQPWNAGENLRPEELMDFLMMRTDGISSPAPLYTKELLGTRRTSPTPNDDFWQRSENGVFYGYMWSLGKKKKDTITHLWTGEAESCEWNTNKLVVPVALVYTTTTNNNNNNNNSHGEGSMYHLVAPAPVHIGPRAKKKLSIQLISHWNPCGALKFMCSAFELWCCADAISVLSTDKTTSSNNDSFILEWIQRRLNGSTRRLRRANGGYSSSQEKEGEPRERRTVYVFPSLPPNIETIDNMAFPIHRCVMSILVVSAESSSQLESSPSVLWRNRMNHFQFSRHLFASLSDTSSTAWRRVRYDTDKIAQEFRRCRKLGYRRTVRIIGKEEREMLLRLVGCEALSDVRGGDVLFQASRTAQLRCSPSNAHQRVLLKFTRKGGREHQREGSSLFVLKPGDPAELLRIGALTSAPFFSMRFGSCVAYAWVWDNVGWGLLQQLYRTCLLQPTAFRESEGVFLEEQTLERTAEPRHATGDSGKICFFISAAEKSSRLSPFLINSPARVPGCSASARPLKRMRAGAPVISDRIKSWHAMEAALCDGDTCFPVEVVRLGSRRG